MLYCNSYPSIPFTASHVIVAFFFPLSVVVSTVAHNELNENKNAAINIAAGKKNLTTISGNILSGSASISGIRLSKCKVSIASNEFEKFKYGIHAAASVSGSIYDNIYSDIAKKEIYIDKKAQKMNTVISSTVETSTDNGKICICAVL